MLAFGYPHMFALLLAPILARGLIPAYREPRPALQVPFMERLSRLTGQKPTTGAAMERVSILRMIFHWVSWLMLVAALARPQWIEAPLTKTVPTRDLLLAVDLSGSMEVEDFTDENGRKTGRLTAVKQVLDEFLTRREGDRTGLIFFGSAPFVQAPFTEDSTVTRTLLDEARVRMAGPQTMLGDAIGLAINVFEQSETEERVLILLTDGNDTGSRAPPRKAAEIARDKGIAIHAVAVGDPAAADEEKLDVETLKAISNITGGVYFSAMDRDELEEVYRRLDEMETRKIETVSHRPKRDLFHWPLTAFFVLGLVYYGAGAARRKRRSGPAGARTLKTAASSLSIPGAFAVLIFSDTFTALGASESSFSPLSSFSGFHFLRPWFFFGLIPALLVAWRIKKSQDSRGPWKGVVSEHLLKHLLVGDVRHRRFRPWHLLALTWFATVLALAGPTWKQGPAPFAEDQAALFIVLKTTPSMTAKDVQPSRLQRAVHKIRDLCQMRRGALHGLIAYSGSAHLVVPLTKDANIVQTFAAELSPEIMPKKGDALAEALQLANERLRRSGLPASVLLIADEIPLEQEKKIAELKNGLEFPVHVLAAANAPDEKSLGNVARSLDGSLTVVSADDSDVERIVSRVERSLQTFVQNREGARWKDSGYLLVPLIAFLSLAWFRKGWVVRCACLVFAFATMAAACTSDLWLTPDQRAARAMERGEYAEAAQLFSDSFRKGTALFRAGEFEAAANAFSLTDTAISHYNRGNSLVMLGQYEEAVAAYDRALDTRPGWTEAMENREIAMLRGKSLEKEGGDMTGGMLAADDIVFDGGAMDKSGGQETVEADSGARLNDEQLRSLWLRGVQTKPADFLRVKFAYQLADKTQ